MMMIFLVFWRGSTVGVLDLGHLDRIVVERTIDVPQEVELSSATCGADIDDLVGADGLLRAPHHLRRHHDAAAFIAAMVANGGKALVFQGALTLGTLHAAILVGTTRRQFYTNPCAAPLNTTAGGVCA